MGHSLRDTASFNELARDGEHEPVRYRAGELVRLRACDYGLCNRVLDHIEVTEYGRLAVIFLTGTRVMVW